MTTTTISTTTKTRVIGMNEPKEVIEARKTARAEMGSSRDYNSRPLWNEMVKTDGSICQITGQAVTPDMLQVSHDVAWSDGGSNDIANLYLACQRHNVRQGTKSLEWARGQSWTDDCHTTITNESRIDDDHYFCNVCCEVVTTDEWSTGYCKRCKAAQARAYKSGNCVVADCDESADRAGCCSTHYMDWKNPKIAVVVS